MEVSIEKQFEEFAKQLNGKYLPVDLIKGRPYPEVEAIVDGLSLHLKINMLPVANGKVIRTITGMNSAYDDGHDPFPFSIRGGYWNNPIDELLSIFKKDVKVGSEKFDDHFVVHSKDSKRIKEVLNEDIQKLLLSLQDAWLEMRHNGTSYEVAFFDVGITVDVERLVDMANLVAMTSNAVKKSAEPARQA